MAITKEQKDEILKGLIDKFSKSKSVIFADYRGLDVVSISDLRGRLREGGAECKVAKKTLISLAAKESNIEGLNEDVMQGPVAATFSYEDELAGLKILFKFSKENENLEILGGIIDGKIIGKDEAIQLAKLPSKEELYAKLLGSMNAPISGFVGTLSNVLGGFVRVVNAYKDSLPAEEVKAEPAPEEKPADKTPDTAEEPKEPATEAPAETSTEEPKEEPAPDTTEEVSDDDAVEEEKPAEETPAVEEEAKLDETPDTAEEK